MDAMEAGIPQVPDLTDNHYEAGGNVLYGDSHVEWTDGLRWTEEFQHGNSK
jgi:prepilin-type processing-associated H-X9-DG protein